MKKFNVVMMALVAVFAFSAVLAATASAEATLLANWLISGAEVTTLTATEFLVTVLREDKAFGAAIECTSTFDGSVGLNGEDEFTEVLRETAKTAASLASPLTVAAGDCKNTSGCSTSAATEVAPTGLPWHTLLFLDETTEKFLDAIFTSGYELTCTILGLKVTDTCTTTNGTVEVLASTEGAEAVGSVSPNTNCSAGGTGSGIEEFKGANHLVTTSGRVPVIPSE